MIIIKNTKTRHILKFAVPVLMIPAVIWFGSTFLGTKSHSFISLAVTVLALLLFICGFEKKSVGTRRLIVVSVMTALSVAGRFIPFFKPITAITVITAVNLGSEAGFLVGALSAVISNFYFGQGPWTPFQMFSWGMIGLLAGILSRPLRQNRGLLIIYGIFSGIAFSFFMDIWTVLWYAADFNLTLYFSSLIASVPHTVLYSISNVIFLYFLAKPFGQKIERIKIKYGL